MLSNLLMRLDRPNAEPLLRLLGEHALDQVGQQGVGDLRRNDHLATADVVEEAEGGGRKMKLIS